VSNKALCPPTRGDALSDNKLRVGIIGAGRMGRVRAETIAYHLPSAALLAISDCNVTAAMDIAGEYGIPRVVPQSEEILNDSRIDAVLIASPTDTHVDLIIGAARAGKHIFCEKPIDRSLARIDSALAAVESAGVKMQIGFNRRFDANFARVRNAVIRGEIGTPYLLHIVSRDPSPPPIAYIRSSGGIFLDMTIHDFDMARFLIGDEVEEVYSVGAVRIDPEIGEAGDLDTAVVLLRFRNGVIGTIDNCRKSIYGYDQRVEILGSAGAVTTNNVYPNETIISTALEVKRDLPLNFFMERYAQSYVNEIRAFVDSVSNDKPILVTGADARIPVTMALAARKSHDEKRPVTLTEITTEAGAIGNG
jgi:myo-inositol 2-dehydrogenase / D-chiro-inositol 1-dehydrogenase